MKLVSTQRCLIGEGPIWNRFNNKLYYVNAKGKNEIHMVDLESGDCFIRQLSFGVAAMGFSVDGRMLVSCEDGAFYLNGDNTREPLYNPLEYKILYGNDAKVGPDGRFYIGTQSRKRKGVGDEIDGKLYSIDKNGIVKVLLDGLMLSNGFEWSIDEKRFYHTDSDTNIIKEYEFDKQNGELYFTGRQIMIPGVDGFTIDQNDMLYVACWGQGHIAVVDTSELKIRDYIRVPTQIPASCGFAGKDMEQLIIVTATSGVDLETDTNAGFTYSCELGVRGRPPFLFG
mgnify:CR=1 FL=1